MNRLWVRISLVLAVVITFIAFLPFVTRTLRIDIFAPPPRPTRVVGNAPNPNSDSTPPSENNGGPPRGDAPGSQDDEFEERIWQEVYRTLLFGSVVGVGAAVILSRWLVAPLGQLEKGTQAVAEQRLDYRLPESGSQEVKSVARAFNQMTAQLERQETLRRNLLADVTHELRHPVHVIQGSLQAVLDGVYPLNLEEIALMFEQTHHLAALVDDLHSLARAEAHELPLYRQETDIGILVKDLSDAMTPLADEKELKLQVTTPETPLVMTVDPQRLRQVVQNLLSNALRYTPNGGSVTVHVAEGAKEATITVQDTGLGIPAEDLPRVFDRFYRGDASRNRTIGGAGLGLAIAKAIAEAHGGTIAADSKGTNQGSIFTLRLPVAATPSAS
jgi:signal transduction histidine kinase